MIKKDIGKKSRIVTYDVYVGHLPKCVNQDKLRKAFLKYGEITDIFCRHGQGNGPLGYAIIKFKNKEDVDRLLNRVDKVHVDGYEMEVKIGIKNNQNVENGDVGHGKTVTFSDQVAPPPVVNIQKKDGNLHVKDVKCLPSTHNEVNGKQMKVVEVICTNVDSAVSFHGCYVFRYEELQNISLKLNSICPNLVRLNRKPLVKRVYGALYEDYRWYRCTVRQVMVPSKPGACIVEYIDYGNIAEVYYTDMVDLPEPIQKIVPFVVKCVFSNLMCNPSSPTHVSYLHHLVNNRMSLSAVLKSYSTLGAPEYQVHNCSSNGIDVINELVKHKHAILRSKLSSKVPTQPEKPSLKNQENQKSKKTSSNKGHSKKITVKETCNDVEKNPCQTGNGAVDNEKNHKIASPDNSEVLGDNIPKRIIKRGDEISDVAPVPVLEGSKSVNNLLKLDCVLANLKLVNNIRNLVSLPVDDRLIDSAVDLLLNEVATSVSHDQRCLLETAHKKYIDTLNVIKECTDVELLPDLKEKRNLQREEFLSVLKQFLDSFDCSLLAKQKEIQELITALESSSNAWMNVCLSSVPETTEELVAEYHKERDLRWNFIQKARENTNKKHIKFMEILRDLKNEFSLNMLDGTSNGCHRLDNCGGKRGSYTLKFEESLTDLGVALEEEMKTCSLTKGKSDVPIIKCILEKLDVPKEKIDNECDIYIKFKSLYGDLNNTSDLNAVFGELYSVQENIQSLILDCSDNTEKLEGRLAELHNHIVQEGMLLEKLAKIAAVHYPELILEHPEFDLLEYKRNWYMLQSNWQKSYFPVFGCCKRIEPAYESKFVEDCVVIKEFDTGSESEKKDLIKKAIIWNEIKSSSLVKIKALFNKGELGIYAMFSQVWENLYDNPLPVPVDNKLACSILQQILKGLVDIHSRGLAHGAIHPMSVLRKEDKVVLDFNYDCKLLQDNFCLKGINFQDPSGEEIYKQTDMYGFGCLVIWVLFPNLSFTSIDKGVPNILAFQSIIQELLSSADFSDLSDLLSSKSCVRPTSKDLYQKGFLKNLRILCKR